jgi:hypothetical protein
MMQCRIMTNYYHPTRVVLNPRKPPAPLCLKNEGLEVCSPCPERILQCRMMQQVRGEIAKVMLAQQKQESSSTLAPRPQWMREEDLDLSDEEADRRWHAGSEALFGSATNSPTPPSPSSFTGGNTIKVTAEMTRPGHHARAKVKVAIDTQSDVTTALQEYVTNIKEILPDRVHGLGGEADFTHEGRIHIWSETKKRKISLPALVAPRHQMPMDCVALLGVPAINALEVAVEQHLKLPQFNPLICHLGEKKLREWIIILSPQWTRARLRSMR